MNLKQFLFILIFGLTLILGFAAFIAPSIGKTAIESTFLMLQALAISTIAIGILIGIALFVCWIYEKLEDKT